MTKNYSIIKCKDFIFNQVSASAPWDIAVRSNSLFVIWASDISSWRYIYVGAMLRAQELTHEPYILYDSHRTTATYAFSTSISTTNYPTIRTISQENVKQKSCSFLLLHFAKRTETLKAFEVYLAWDVVPFKRSINPVSVTPRAEVSALTPGLRARDDAPTTIRMQTTLSPN